MASDRRRMLQAAAGGLAAGWAMPVGAAQTPVSPPRANLQAGAVELRDPRFGVAGDGAQDDSRAFEAFLDEIDRTGLPGIIAPGRYRLPRLRARTTRAPLVLVGAGQGSTTLDAEGNAPEHWIGLNHVLDVSGLTFRRFRNVFVLSDGSNEGYGENAPERFDDRILTHDIAALRISGCAFYDCRRPLIGFVSDAHRIGRVTVEDNVVERAWAGFYLNAWRLDDVMVLRNRISDIDGSPAGYTPRGNPVRSGGSAGIHLGADRIDDGENGSRWLIQGNIIRNVTDRRSRGPDVTAEVSGIHVWGAQWIDISHNIIENIHSAGLENCEGIYGKIRNARVVHNTMINAGLVEAAIMLKGNGSGRTGTKGASDGWNVVCAYNHLWTDREDTLGIGIVVDRVDCSHNYLEGFNPKNPSYAPIFVDTERLDGVRIRGNTIRRTRGRSGISCRNYGKGLIVEDNVIDGVDASGIRTNENACGILVRNSTGGAKALTDVVIRGNRLRDIVRPRGKLTRAFCIEADKAEITQLEITGNTVETPVSEAFFFSGPVADVTLRHNRFDEVSGQAPFEGFETLPGLTAIDNAGFDSVEVETPAIEIETGRSHAHSLSFPGARFGDTAVAQPRSALRSLLHSAQVNAADEVTVLLANLTAETVELPAIRWTVRLEKRA